MKYVGEIDLTAEERALLDQITIDLDPDDDQSHATNVVAIPKLMASLLHRSGIPEHRVAYFTNPRYRSGRMKGSHRDIFERNGIVGREIFEQYSFLKFLRYFLLSADLPSEVIEDFKAKVERLSPITDDDVRDLWDHAKALANKYRIEPHDAAEEFFKLCLDCGVPLIHAAHVRDVVSKMRLRKERCS